MTSVNMTQKSKVAKSIISNETELLHGMMEIAEYLGVRRSTGYHMAEHEGMPTFKLAGKVCARRSSLEKWLAEREAAAMEVRNGAGR